MIIIDQETVEGSGSVNEIHEKMLTEHFMFERIDELSAMGLTIFKSAGFTRECEFLADVVNADLLDYDFRIKDTKYKLKNVSFV